MKNLAIISIVVLLLSTYSIAAKPTWISSYDDALKTARVLNKPILIDFWATWCGPCKKMDSEVWNKEDVQLLMQNFVNLKVDIDVEVHVARKYSVRGIPNIFIIDGWGNILYSSVGYQNASAIKKILKNFSVNMTGIYQSLAILEKSEDNVFSNLRVAQKYQDVGFVLDQESQKSFLNESNDFFKKGLKLIEDNDKLVEKVNLLMLLSKAYIGGEKGVLKRLKKDFKSINESNTNLYTYIEFVCYNSLKNIEEKDACYSKLVALNATTYLKKANYLLKQNDISN